MIFFIYLALILIGMLILGMIFLWIRDYSIRKSRSEDKKEDFLDFFVKEGISESLALSAYHSLQNWMNLKDFPVRPQDSIADIYGIVDEDLVDLIVEIAEANNFEVPTNTKYWQEPILTVEDLIRFIASFPRKDFFK